MPAEPFGPRLRRLMDRSGLAEHELAERAGCRTTDVMRLRCGAATVDDLSVRRIVLIAAALGCSTDELLGVESPVVRRLREALDEGGELRGPLLGLVTDANFHGNEYARKGLAFLRSLLPESEGT